MMLPKSIFPIIGLGLTLIMVSCTATPETPSTNLESVAVAHLEPLLAEKKLAGAAVRVVKGDEVLLNKAWGYADLEWEVPITGDNDELCKHAGWTLASIAVDPALSDDVVARGGLPLLIRYAQSPNPVYQEEAAWGLANISSISQHAVPLMHAGIIPPMVALTRSEVQGVRMQALWTLANLAVHQDFRLQISADGAIPALVHCLARLGAEDEHCLVQAARALSNLIVAPRTDGKWSRRTGSRVSCAAPASTPKPCRRR